MRMAASLPGRPRVQMAKRVITLAMPSFTPGMAMGRGDLGLNEKDDHGDGREHGHGGEFSDIHYDTPSSWDDVPLSMTWMTRRLGRQAMGEAVWSVGPVRTQIWSGSWPRRPAPCRLQ